ncbi:MULTISPECIES: hypothetical protein [Simplicispira]|jgi:hypothetical protein|uniref:Uncharacterized protein n=1 Tax=Simplicispira metamorpha TaxID=80881 RepID=A0A4R2NG76_9BURK|nr:MULTISPECIES: hypothetical protein [Simplicispira]MBP7413482.1 hypothetical protein [Giesbergeria sp.]MBP8204425.1 hypothetical protein [Giesbergeria sp.]MDD2691847.1 hypothetical protein [Simplicispira sp.]TCP20363.1 hypothetical protein EV674_10111 [Simplicispira metamorpha]
MPTESERTEEALAAHLQRMSGSIEQLSARIARLASALDVDLQNESELDRVLNMDGGGAPAHERRAAANSALPAGSPERRKSHLREELRGLLVLRYGVTRRFVDRVGVDATRHILVNAQDQLEREGFKPGAAGADLRRLFDGF